QLYAWQSSSDSSKPLPLLRGAKLLALLNSIYRDEDQIQRVNFIDRGLFIIMSGYDIKGLKRAITWCWESASKIPHSLESYLRTSAEYLLDLHLSYSSYYIDLFLMFFLFNLRLCDCHPRREQTSCSAS